MNDTNMKIEKNLLQLPRIEPRNFRRPACSLVMISTMLLQLPVVK
jgi:hypothetical protein